MAGSGLSVWLFWVGAGITAVAGLVLLFWALWGDRARGRRRCPRCWYDMSATPGTTCPECGRVAMAEKRLYRSRRRWRWAAAAALLLVGALALAVTPTVRADGWLRLAPTAGLIAALPYLGDPTNTYKNELYERVDRRGLSPWQRRFLFSRCDVVLKSESSSQAAKMYALRQIENVAWRGGYYGRPTSAAYEAVPVLVDAMKSTDDKVRAFSCGIMGTVARGGPPEAAVRALAGVVSGDKNGDVRRSAVRSLYDFGKNAAPATGAVIKCLKFRGTPYLRRDATLLLGTIGADADGVVLATLIKLMDDDETEVRSGAAEAIGKLGPAAKSAAPRLLAALQSPELLMRKCAARSLGEIGDSSDSVIDGLLAAAGRDTQMAAAYEAVLAAMRLRKGDAALQARVAETIGKWPTREAAHFVAGLPEMKFNARGLEAPVVAMLETATLDPKNDWEAYFEATRHLCRVGYSDAAVLPAARRAMENAANDRIRVWCTVLIAAIEGDRLKAAPALVKMIRESDESKGMYSRGDAAEALGVLGPGIAEGTAGRDVVAILESMLQDEAWHSRECARKTLRAITGREYGKEGDKWPARDAADSGK